MPKISSENVRINDRHYSVEIFYSSQIGLFYTKVPDQFQVEFRLLDKRTLNELNARKDERFRGDKRMDIIIGSTEGEALQNFKKCANLLSQMATKVRPIIMIFYSDRGSSFDTDKGVRNSLEKITFDNLNMTFGFLYAEELRIADQEPKYYQTRKYEFHGETREDKKEIHQFSAKRDLVIDDTPESRAFLENLYSAFGSLISKMKDFTKDESSILSLISSQQKLLS